MRGLEDCGPMWSRRRPGEGWGGGGVRPLVFWTSVVTNHPPHCDLSPPPSQQVLTSSNFEEPDKIRINTPANYHQRALLLLLIL